MVHDLAELEGEWLFLVEEEDPGDLPHQRWSLKGGRVLGEDGQIGRYAIDGGRLQVSGDDETTYRFHLDDAACHLQGDVAYPVAALATYCTLLQHNGADGPSA